VSDVHAPTRSAAEGFVPTEDGERLFYRVDGQGLPVVVLHGGPGFNMTYLRDDFLPLARTHRLIFYDQRGGGRSSLVLDDARISLDAHVDDVEAVRRYFGLERLTLIGHSWGAGLAGQYAVRFPVRVATLALVTPMVPRHVPYRAEFVRNRTAWMDAATRVRFAALEAALALGADPVAAARAFYALYFRGFFADRRQADGARIRVADDPPEALANHARGNTLTMASLGDYDWREELRAVRARALVVHGAADPIPLEASREWAASIAGARLLVIEECGHFPQIEQAQIFFGAINDFLGDSQ
jgi:proline iminopeptidase